MRSEVYFNLHKKMFSVRALEGPNKGRVVDHFYQTIVEEPDFVVQQGGRNRVLREGKKNVHAFVRGNVRRIESNDFSWIIPLTRHPERSAAWYNPYRDAYFRRATGITGQTSPLFWAKTVFMTVTDGKPRMYYSFYDEVEWAELAYED